MTTKRVMVTFQREGWHCWPSAPMHREYLRRQHRHLFHIKVSVEVVGEDREVEFHDLLDFSKASYTLLPSWSCEMAAAYLAELVKRWLDKDMKVEVEVWEDGECGARVEA